ncbi:MAG: aryl-sulfate sulfotransferase [Saprospiraceae bacterium]|nr:aryl-sulfate sulfotransferase [Saprospiraceae bacterium]
MKKQQLFLLTLLLHCVILQLPAQNTVGLLSYEPSLTYDGYNLIYPHNQPNVYLLDNCGELVHVWEDSTQYRPGNTAYLLADGRLLKTKRASSVVNDAIWAGGGGAIVEIRDWDNNLEWSYTINNDTARLHHDVEPLPNGNILMIVWELKTEEEAIQAGRAPNTLDNNELWPDYIIEVDPSTDEIVWEWHFWDHLIQDIDPSKDNYGVVEDNPGRLDINFDDDGTADWLHCNSIDYNPEMKQILLSTPFLNEVYIIDHSTSTEQAAGDIGGLGGNGGNFMFRWGNPQVYRAGVEEDQKLFNNHDAHWVLDFVDEMHPQFGKIAIFNNQAGPDFSTVNTINPSWDMYSWSYLLFDGQFGPGAFDVTITHPEPTALYSTGLSSVQFLPNNNVLICSGRFGYNVELTPDNQVVWEYRTPLDGGQAVAQGTELSINNNLTFRIDRYPGDYAAFADRSLDPLGWIELEPDSTFCGLILPTTDLMKDYSLNVYPNPATNMLTIEWQGGVYVNIEIFDILGRRIDYFRATGGRKYLDISQWREGVYVVQIGGVQSRKIVVR